MAWQWTPYTVLLVAAAVISAVSALYVWLRRLVPGNQAALLVALANAAWMLGYALELGSVDLVAKVSWNKAQYLGVVIVPGAWLTFTLQYTGREKWLTRRNLVMLTIEPIITLMLVFTNEAHGLIWGPTTLDTDGPVPVLAHSHRVGYWIHGAYTYALLLISVFLLAQMLVRSRSLYQRQAGLLLFATLLPCLGSVVMVSGLSPLPHLDLTPLAFTASSLILTWSLFRVRVGDIVPVARGIVVESMSDSVIVLDAQDRIVDLNPVARRMIGRAASETIGHSMEQVWPDWPGLIERSDERNGTSEEVVLSKGDVQRTYDVRTSPIFDWRGHLASRVIVLRDVTERKQAREALQQYAERLRTLQMIDEAILATWSPEEIGPAALRHMLQLVSCQRASVALFDFGANDVTLLSVHVNGETELDERTCFPLEGIEGIEALRQGQVLVVEDVLDQTTSSTGVQVLQANGLRSYIHVPLISEGELIGCLNLGAKSPSAFAPEHQDIAREVADHLAVALHQARLRSVLEAEQQRLGALVEHLPEGIFLLDGERRVLLHNPVAETYLPTLTGDDVGDVLTHLADCPVEELLQSPPEGPWHELEVPGRVFEAVAQPVAGEAEIGRWVLLVRDVTEEREIQRRVQQQERLAAVGQLASGVAHDFNNIIATIILYTQLLLRTQDLSSKSCERLMTISQQAMHATNLIDQILDFSRRSVLERRPMDLVPLFKELVKLLERTLPENIRVELDYEPSEYIVNADPTRMQQVIMNLALNGRDAMPKGGELRIGLGRVQTQPGETPPLPEMKPGAWVGVTVSDTGTGIPPDVLPHIYEPFFTTKAPGQGSGLGLAQVYGIVTQHEGCIDLKSHVGHGTTFILYLPALPVLQRESLAPEVTALAMGRGETILVVEDDPVTRTALRDTLEMLDYRVLVATNGREAMRVFEQHAKELALVVSDLVMPEMGGKDLVRKLKQVDPHLKALAITGYVLGEDAQELREEGIPEIVRKPFKVSTLAEAIRRVLDAE
jgi:two-component system cell cycle sensor histidine kinase/response regulator CckA